MNHDQLIKYSQHLDLTHPEHKLSGCGIASLGMLLGDKISTLDELYKLGLEQGAYLPGIGWRHAGLANLAKHFGFTNSYNLDLAKEDLEVALEKLKTELKQGPVLASVFTNYEPGHKEGHIVVLLSLTDEQAEVLDPAAKNHNDIHQFLPVEKFINGWKKRLIVIRE
ncbi:MAG: cysteine peptidase family C39 domain-containing protein [bacterium]|nr:cysteine peptidase family C39 domain-containing protein [bacterium]